MQAPVKALIYRDEIFNVWSAAHKSKSAWILHILWRFLFELHMILPLSSNTLHWKYNLYKQLKKNK